MKELQQIASDIIHGAVDKRIKSEELLENLFA
jgi:hypothetical protein